MTLAIAAIVVWIGLWALNVMLARWLPERQARIAVPIIFGLTLVLVVELLNSAIESVVDRIGEEAHALSGRAKDMGSAAVLFSLLMILAAWAPITWTRFHA